MFEAGYVAVRGATTAYEVADVFREYGAAYRQQYGVTPEQARVMGAIIACRTAQLGGHILECAACGAVEFAYHSCRDRHCPKCQKFERAQWVEKQKVMRLPIPYFHVVFTTDHAINEWAPANRGAIYNLLFETAAATLKAFAAQAWGGELGMTAVLHTWGQTLQPHVHVHCVVTGGALSFDGKRWCRCQAEYLFDIVAVSAAFRDRFCAGLLRLAEQGQLVGVEVDVARATLAELQAKAWEVFAKPFANPQAVYEYLSRYVHQVAISNTRISALADGQVSFTYHDNQAGGQLKEMTLTAVEFIRRFLWHVLPDGFVRIRYYGLHHSQARARKLPRCRVMLGLAAELPEVKELAQTEWLEEVVGVELHRCRFCGACGALSYRGEVGDMPWVWLMLKVLLGWVLAWQRRAQV